MVVMYCLYPFQVGMLVFCSMVWHPLYLKRTYASDSHTRGCTIKEQNTSTQK